MIQKLPLSLLADADIVVVGGGPSGFAAAIAAARTGGKVLLLEQSSMFGGLGTAGLVPMFAPASDGERMIYGGIFDEVNREMCRRMAISSLLPVAAAKEAQRRNAALASKALDAVA